ncbi:putative IgGFc-binding protein-like [Apostichopus japonicus]|uniref:Putative IgGFc-binding protein-like n=1 Tax=Stichopus japonicus TaxID=307972 RepID=A0A2G8KXB2_STIJA|nr:putative IgGFc-binding protein-like [Apostichopus japonicus]
MIKPDGYLEPFEVYCDDTDSSGGWTVSYDNFRISDEFSNYKFVSLGQYSGITDVITFCPYNMVYRNCSNSCQRTCGAPEMCQDGVCNEAEACVCSDGYFMKGSDCVPQEQCGCYESETQTVIPEGGSYVNPGCTRKGVCTNGQITWDEAYACSPNAVCDVRDNIRQCYCTGGYRGDGRHARDHLKIVRKSTMMDPGTAVYTESNQPVGLASF